MLIAEKLTVRIAPLSFTSSVVGPFLNNEIHTAVSCTETTDPLKVRAGFRL